MNERIASSADVATITRKVIEIISEKLNIPAQNITRESSFVEDLKADSLAVTEVGLLVEDIFAIQVEDELLTRARTVGDIVDYIVQRRAL